MPATRPSRCPSRPNGGPRVSVIIPTFNQSKLLIEAVESALAQAYRPIEVIVVDDGSTDDTAQRIRPYAAGGQVLYLHQVNRRQAAARNTGIAASQGDLIAFLDHDDLWAPDKLARQVPLFSDPEVALVYCGAEEVNLERKRLWIKGVDKYRRGRIFDPLLHDHFITNSSVVIRRSVLAQTGSFREEFYGVDDIHLWLRICHDNSADFVPEILVSCRRHTANMKIADSGLAERRFLALVDIYERFGLDHQRPQQWRRLHADHHFHAGYALRREHPFRAFQRYMRSFSYCPERRPLIAAAKLLLPLPAPVRRLLQRD